MSVELKIKSKHLALESKVIRFEEAKVKKQIKWLQKNKPVSNSTELYSAQLGLCSLSNHRKYVVGRENRATFLARAYLAGTPYKKVEIKRREDKHFDFNVYVLPRVLEMVKKYGNGEMRRTISLDILKEWSKIE